MRTIPVRALSFVQLFFVALSVAFICIAVGVMTFSMYVDALKAGSKLTSAEELWPLLIIAMAALFLPSAVILQTYRGYILNWNPGFVRWVAVERDQIEVRSLRLRSVFPMSEVCRIKSTVNNSFGAPGGGKDRCLVLVLRHAGRIAVSGSSEGYESFRQTLETKFEIEESFIDD